MTSMQRFILIKQSPNLLRTMACRADRHFLSNYIVKVILADAPIDLGSRLGRRSYRNAKKQVQERLPRRDRLGQVAHNESENITLMNRSLNSRPQEPVDQSSYFSNQASMLSILAIRCDGRLAMPCEASGKRTSAVSIFLSFSAW